MRRLFGRVAASMMVAHFFKRGSARLWAEKSLHCPLLIEPEAAAAVNRTEVVVQARQTMSATILRVWVFRTPRRL
jgi:hypothetical protein